jgi:nucleoside-diphosphate-sugar epimerase
MNPHSFETTSEPELQRLTTLQGAPPRPTKVTLLGATGFIGSRILRSLQADESITVSILTRRPTGLVPFGAGRSVIGDLLDPSAVENAVAGADVVINSASYVGRDVDLAEKVNAEGVLSVIRASEQAGVRQLIQISTTAVYGSGPHRGLTSEGAAYAPESVASKARAKTDRAVLAAGGTVVRPNLVYGPGDRWVIPGLMRMVTALGSTINEGSAKLSLIDVMTLGKLVAALTTAATSPGGVFHATDPEPVTLARLLGAVEENICQPVLAGSCSAADAIRKLAVHGFSSHQVNMVAWDHYYEAARLWDIAGLEPQGLRLAAPETRDWYRGHLTRPAVRIR